MSGILIAAITAITLALVFYTIGVWSEHREKILKVWHVVVFYIGLVCDTTGTTLMMHIAQSGAIHLNHVLEMIHGITGLLAIFLMLFHAVWATVVIIRKDPKQMANFHKFSVFVWSVWLIPYVIGMVIGMMH